MPQNIQTTIIATNLEVAMIGREPAIHNLDYIDFAFAQVEAPGRLFPTMPGIAFHRNLQVVAHAGVLIATCVTAIVFTRCAGRLPQATG